MIIHIQSPGTVRTVNLYIFKDIDVYSITLVGADIGKGRGLPCPF